MTQFNKDDFNFDGMYLTYRGAYEGAKLMNEVHPDCHPSWIGKLKPAFVARFKYSGGYKTFMNFLIKNFTCEEYFGRLDAGESPLEVLKSKGYLQPHIKKMLKAKGYEVSAAGMKQMVADQVSDYYAKKAA